VSFLDIGTNSLHGACNKNIIETSLLGKH